MPQPARQPRVLGLLAVTLALVLAFPASAAPKDDDKATAEAREHVSKAKVHYKLGEFDQAIAEFKEAYRLKPIPAILFNIGQAFRMAGNYRQSKFYYENYLRDMPNASNREEVERQVAELDKLVADGAPPATPPAKAEAKVAPKAEPKPEPKEAARAEAKKSEPAKSEVAKPPAKDLAKAEPTRSEVAKAEGAKATPAITTPTTTVAPPAGEAKKAKPEVPAGALATGPAEVESGSKLPLALGAASAALAVAGAVTYGLARTGWSDATAQERPRAEVDAIIASADTKYTAALGLGGAALVAGLGAAVTFAF